MLTTSFAALCLIAAAGDSETRQPIGIRNRCRSFRGKTPPELVSDKEHWIGATEQVTLTKLKGHVVWLQFNF